MHKLRLALTLLAVLVAALIAPQARAGAVTAWDVPSLSSSSDGVALEQPVTNADVLVPMSGIGTDLPVDADDDREDESRRSPEREDSSLGFAVVSPVLQKPCEVASSLEILARIAPVSRTGDIRPRPPRA